MPTITIGDKDIKVTEDSMPQQSLLFDVDNPRVYTALRENENDDPTQSEIEEKMRSLDHVKELKQQIEQNGGLIEPLIVLKRNDDYIVIEGNSRLAAYRMLAEQNPAKWGYVRVNILPENISMDEIDTLLGTYHLTPKKDWSKYEQAAYIYRIKSRDNIPDQTLAKRLGLSVPTIKKYIEIYEFMKNNSDTKQSHWNSYAQFVTKPAFKRYRELMPEIDSVMAKQIKTGDIKQAKDIRDKLAKIANSTDKSSNRIMKDFINEKIDIDDAYARFEATGKSGNNYKKIKDFRNLITSDDFVKSLQNEAIANKDISFELKKIKRAVDKVLTSIEKIDKHN